MSNNDYITDTAELREFMGSGADSLNIFLATSTLVTDEEANEHKYLSYGTTFQVEGYVLQPRKLRAIPVEIVTDDGDDTDYILGLVRGSQAHLAERQADAVGFASQRLPSMNGMQNSTLSGLGEMREHLDAKQEA